jgi:hypothetical protein
MKYVLVVLFVAASLMCLTSQSSAMTCDYGQMKCWDDSGNVVQMPVVSPGMVTPPGFFEALSNGPAALLGWAQWQFAPASCPANTTRNPSDGQCVPLPVVVIGSRG